MAHELPVHQLSASPISQQSSSSEGFDSNLLEEVWGNPSKENNQSTKEYTQTVYKSGKNYICIFLNIQNI